MKENKAFQTLVAAFVLIAIWRLYQEGWFQSLMSTPAEGEEVESVDLTAAFLAVVWSSLQTVGLLAIGIVAGVLPVLQSTFESISQMLKPKKPAVDELQFNETLRLISKRLETLENANAKPEAIDEP